MKKQKVHIPRKTYHTICNLVANYGEFKQRVDLAFGKLSFVKCGNGIINNGSKLQSTQEQYCTQCDKIKRSAVAQNVYAIEHGVNTAKLILAEYLFDLKATDRIVRAFIKNCEGYSFVYLQRKFELPMSRQLFTLLKGYFIRDIAEHLGYIGDIVSQ
jgi:hypothetical protein